MGLKLCVQDILSLPVGWRRRILRVYWYDLGVRSTHQSSIGEDFWLCQVLIG